MRALPWSKNDDTFATSDDVRRRIVTLALNQAVAEYGETVLVGDFRDVWTQTKAVDDRTLFFSAARAVTTCFRKAIR